VHFVLENELEEELELLEEEEELLDEERDEVRYACI
jgi:hypothetical protein